MLPLKNYRNLPIGLRPGLDEPLMNVTYAAHVQPISGQGMSDWLKSAQEERRKFPPRVPEFDADSLVSKAWIQYHSIISKPPFKYEKSRKQKFQWWLRQQLVKWGVI